MASTPTRNTPRYYPPHHYLLLPAAFIIMLYSIRRYADVAGDDSEFSRLWFTLMVLAVVGFGVLVMLRQHYALRLQDRLIRVEMRQRYFELTGQSLRPLEDQLQLRQILALRLAGDAELPNLVQAALREKLSPKAIQARIQHFQFDHLRV